MGKEHFIIGKHDNGKHDGKRANELRKQLSEEEIVEFWKSVWPELFEAHDIVFSGWWQDGTPNFEKRKEIDKLV